MAKDGIQGRRMETDSRGKCERLHRWGLIPNVTVLMIVTSYEL
jgi:hypothetical protein